MPPFFISLPETVWAEVNRRLRCEPALWELTANPKIAAAFVEQGDDLALWRPGQLGLAALASLEPQSATDPIRWLKTNGRDHLSKAYSSLVSPLSVNSKEQKGIKDTGEHPKLVQAALAAIALRQRLTATHDLAGLVADAAASPERWALPLVCLYGLLDDPKALIVALLGEAAKRPQAFTQLCELAARILIANETPGDLTDTIGGYLDDLPPALRLAFARFFAGRGLDSLARAAALNPQALSVNFPDGEEFGTVGDLPALFRALAESLECIFLSELAGDESSRRLLGRAVEAAQTFTADLALHLGHRSLAADDPISATAAFQEAQALRPYDRRTHALLAEASALRGDERAALIALGDSAKGKTIPAARLAAARAYHKLGDTGQARESALAVLDCAECHNDLAEVEHAAELLSATDDHASAARAWAKVIAQHPPQAKAYLAHARHALALNQSRSALDSAWQAVGLEPLNTLARQILAEALALTGDAAAALAHWSRAAELDPGPVVQLKRADAALNAHEPELALEIAESILKNSEAESIAKTGLPQIVAGRALTALNEVERAFEYFNQAVALAPASVESWRAVAGYHKSRGDAQRALAALDAGRRLIDPTSPEAADFFADLGELRAGLHHLAEATNAFEKAAQLKPNRIDILKRLGELYRLQNKVGAAIEVIQRAASVAVSDPALWHLLGQMFESAGRFGDALAAYRHAQAAGGAFVELFRDLGRLAYQQGDLPVARGALEQILVGREKFVPADLDPLAILGAIYEGSKEFESALAVYRHAIVLDPLRSDLCVRLGVCCLELGQPEAAIAALKDTAERDLDNLELQRLMGQAYTAAHLWTEAELAYQQACRLAPDDGGLLQLLAGAARRAGEPNRAIAALGQAIALVPDNADYRRDLAELYISQNKLVEAKSTYAEACRLLPTSDDLWMGLGQVHLMLSEVKEAAASFDKAAGLKPNRGDVLMAVGETQWLLRKFETAHAAFARATELEPADPVPLRRAGECMWELGRHAVAIALWQKVLISHPHDAATHARLGEAYKQQGRYAESLAEFEQATAASPADPNLAAGAARLALQMNEPDRAIVHLQRAANLKADDAEIWQLLGEAYRIKGHVDQALQAIRKAIRLAPNSGLAHAALARLLAEAGKVAEAITSAEAALKASPEDSSVLSTTGQVFTQAGRYVEAIDLNSKVVQAHPDDPSAHLALARTLVLHAESEPNDSRRLAKSETSESIIRSLERAAALGAETLEVREWTGRVRALLGQLTEAVALLESVAAGRPSAPLLRTLAACYRRLGQLAPARQTIHSALEHAPEAVENLIELGLICLAQEDKTAARAAFQRAIGINIHCARAYQLLADTMIAAGERAEAMVVYNQALSLDPVQAAWHHRLAELYEASRDSASALAHYQRAAALAVQQALPASETAGYLAALARAYARDRDLESARQQFEAALELRTDAAIWWAQCARINYELKNFERAFECFSQACELQPGDTASFMGAARAALALGREDEAEEKVLSILRQDPENYDALIAMAEVFEKRKDHGNALTAYTQAIKVANNPVPALLAQARLYRELKRPAEAITNLTQAAKLVPDDDEAIALLGEALAEAGQTVEAIQYLQRAVQIAPRNVGHYLRLGRLCRLAGQLDAALGHLQHARDLAPENGEALREMAAVFEGRRQFNRAYEAYQQLIALEPGNADNFFRAGIALKEMHDYLDALTLFQQAVKLDPNNLEAQHQRATVAAYGILRGKN